MERMNLVCDKTNFVDNEVLQNISKSWPRPTNDTITLASHADPSNLWPKLSHTVSKKCSKEKSNFSKRNRKHVIHKMNVTDGSDHSSVSTPTSDAQQSEQNELHSGEHNRHLKLKTNISFPSNCNRLKVRSEHMNGDPKIESNKNEGDMQLLSKNELSKGKRENGPKDLEKMILVNSGGLKGIRDTYSVFRPSTTSTDIYVNETIGFHLTESLSEFPDLKSSTKFKREIRKNYLKQTHTKKHIGIDDNNSNFYKKSNVVAKPNHNKEHSKNSDNNNAISSSSKKTRKKIKRDGPIKFNLMKALQVLKGGHLNKQNDKKLNDYKHKKITKCQLLSGNKLDSDNPIRKRGKYREIKKTKYTRIKRQLINERQIKAFLMNEGKMELETDKKLFVNNSVDKGILFSMNSGNKNELCTVSKDTDKSTGCDFDPKTLIHTRKFRPYCDQWPIQQMKDSVHSLIKTLVRFQDRAYEQESLKARAKPRFVCGIHEVMKYIPVNKTKLIIIATDIECDLNGKGAVTDLITQLTRSAAAVNIPYVYCGTRWSIGNSFKKKRPISSAAILNYEGAEDLYKKVIQLLPEVRSLYDENLKRTEHQCGISRTNVEDDVTGACIKSLLSRLIISDDENEDERKNALENNEVNPFMTAILNRS